MAIGKRKSILVVAVLAVLLGIACIGWSYSASADGVPEAGMKTSFRRHSGESGLTTEVDVAPSVNTGVERGRTGFSFKLNNYQLTGVAYNPGAPFTVTVEAGKGVPTPSLVFAQNWYQSGESSYNTVKLRNGVNRIYAPSDSEPGVLYIANDYNVSVKVTIAGGYTYPVYAAGQTDLAAFKAEVSARYTQIREGNSDSMIAYPDIVDLVSERNLITSTVTGAKSVFVDKGADPAETLENYDKALSYMYELVGFDNSDEKNRIPTNRMHTRANDVPLPFHATSGYIMLTGASSQYDVLSPTAAYGWGLLHEMGHVLDNKSISYPETTNNYYVLRTMEHFSVRGADRLTAEGRYNTLFGEFSSQQQLQFQHSAITADTIHELGIWSRLAMMEQLEMYFNKHFPEKGSFFGNITRQARNHPLSGVGFQEYNFNDIIVHAANVYGVDIRNHFKIQGMDYAISYQAEKKLGEINRTTPLQTLPAYLKYMNASYAAYQGSGFGEGVTAEITEVTEKGDKNLIKVSGNAEADALAGYELYRKSGSNESVYIGFTASDTFLDVKPTKETEYTYFALPISKALTAGTLSQGYKFSRSENESLAEIKLTDIEYDTLTGMLTVTGNGYDGENTVKVTVNGIQYAHGDLSGSSYTKFVSLGTGEWQMRITNYSAENVDTISVFAELMRQKADNVDDETLIWETLRESDVVENTLFAVSTRATASSLLKGIAFLSDDTARLDATVNGVYDLTDDTRRLDTEFDPLTYTYFVRRASRVTVGVGEEPETVIAFRPTAADEHALVQVRIDGVLQSDHAVRIVTDRSQSRTYTVTVTVAGNYGKDNDQTYTFTIDCPSEESRADNIKIEGKAANKAALKINNLTPDNSVTGTRADGFTDSDTLTAAIDLIDSAASYRFYAFIGGDFKKVVGEGKDINQVSPLSIQTPQNEGGIVLVITAKDGVTQSFYPLYAALPDDWQTVADLRSLVVKNGYEVRREKDGNVTVIEVAYTSTSIMGLDVQITPYYVNTDTKKASVMVQSDYFQLSAERGITIEREDFDTFAQQPIAFTITSADGKNTAPYILKLVDSDEISMDTYNRTMTGFTGGTLFYGFNGYVPGESGALTEFDLAASRYIFAPSDETADMQFRIPYSPYQFKAAYSIEDGSFIRPESAQNGYYTVTVPAGTQRFRLRLISPSGKKTQTYSFIRYRSDDSFLTEITQTAGELVSTDAAGNVVSDFFKDITDYTVYTDSPDDFSLSQLTGLVTGDANAQLTISIDGVVTEIPNGSVKIASLAVPKSDSGRVVEIEVKAANGTTTVYRFELRRKAAADVSALQEILETVRYKKQAHYSAGWEALEATRQQAENLLKENNVLQEYVDEMANKLSAARAGLVAVKEFSSLTYLGDRIAMAEGISNGEGVYTEASFAAFTKALAEAKDIYTTDNADEAAAAVEKLNAARTALTILGMEPPVGGGDAGNRSRTWLIVGISLGVAALAGATITYLLLKKKRLAARKIK